MALVPELQNILNGLGVTVDVHSSLLLFGLIFGRLASAFSLTPFLGGQSVPGQVKVGLAAAMAFVLFPSLVHSAGAPPASSLLCFALLVKELMVGAMIGFITQLVFYGVQTAGIVIDTQRGMNQITYLAPQLPGHVSALGNLQFQASLVLFLAIQGHLIFLRALAESFVAVPLLRLPHLAAGWEPISTEFARLSANALLTGCQLAAPVVLAIFLVDVSFGCIGKVASSLRISNDANVAKSWIGLAVFFVASAFFLERLQAFLAAMVPAVSTFARSLP
jgi:flagellar biosynthetic protein FliR